MKGGVTFGYNETLVKPKKNQTKPTKDQGLIQDPQVTRKLESFSGK